MRIVDWWQQNRWDKHAQRGITKAQDVSGRNKRLGWVNKYKHNGHLEKRGGVIVQFSTPRPRSRCSTLSNRRQKKSNRYLETISNIGTERKVGLAYVWNECCCGNAIPVLCDVAMLGFWRSLQLLSEEYNMKTQRSRQQYTEFAANSKTTTTADIWAFTG